MPQTSPAVPAWFYHVTNHDMFDYDKKNIDDLCQVFKDTLQASYIAHEMSQTLSCLFASGDTKTVKDKAINLLLQARETLQERRLSLDAAARQAKEAVDANKYLTQRIEQELIIALNELDCNQMVTASGYEVRTKLKPGTLKTDVEPSEADYDKWGEGCVKRKFEWDIANIKAGLAAGDLSHEWAESKGFRLIRDQGITIKKCEDASA
jgi:hypothetical protein